MGIYADWMIQTDAAVGTVLDAVDQQGIACRILFAGRV
jgi:arylsulfatase A-like enzyme